MVRVRDDGDRQDIAAQLGNGEADAVNRDRAFIHEVTIELRRNPQFHPPVVAAQRFERPQFTNAIHVALHDVAAQPVRQRERTLQIDFRSNLQEPQIAAADRLRGEVDRQGCGIQLDGSETYAVDGNTRAAPGSFEHLAARNLEARTAAFH